MDGIEKITARIQQDAQAEIKRLVEETDQKVNAVMDEAQAQAEKEKAEILSRGKKAAQERLERLESAASMEKRKLQLAAKQEVLGEAFELALKKLCELPEKEYVELMTRLVLEASTTGREQLIFSVKDRNRVGKQVVVAANEAMVKQVAPELPNSLGESKVGAFLGKVVNNAAAQFTGTGLLTLSEQTRPIQGGFIMVDGDIEINCAFETLVRMQREKMEKEVAQVLFG